MPALFELMAANPTATLVCEGGLIVYANPAAEGLWGEGHRCALQGLSLGDVIPPADAARLLDDDADPAPSPITTTARTRAGVEIVVSARAVHQRGPPPSVCLFLERVGWGRTNLDLRALIEAVPTGLLVVGEDGLIQLANAELERQFGYDPGDLIGRSVDLLLPPEARAQHPDLRSSYQRKPLPRPMGAGRELLGVRKNGDAFPVEIGLTPLPGVGSTQVIATVADVSERRRLELNFRRAFEAAPCGMLIIDDEGRIRSANERLADMFGHPLHALIGAPLEKLIPDRHRQVHIAHRTHYAKDRTVRAMGPGRELTGLHRDGSEVPVEIGLSPIETDLGPGVLGLVVEITERRRIEQDLRQANANLEEFTYVASHDLRSPLRGIADLMEWIEEDLGETAPPDVVKNLKRVHIRVGRMERLIDDLLAYARAGRIYTELKNVDLAQLVEAQLEVEPLPEGFVLRTALKVPTLQAPQTPLGTVLRNLISNAIKHHNRREGTIEISSYPKDAYCMITVRDDGPGIPEEARERVFKLFQTSSTSEQSGSGVGLALTKRLVECHGGRIGIRDPESGPGTLFEIAWPLYIWRDNNG